MVSALQRKHAQQNKIALKVWVGVNKKQKNSFITWPRRRLDACPCAGTAAGALLAAAPVEALSPLSSTATSMNLS